MIDGNHSQRKPVIISICGPSNAGKSQLAKATARLLGNTIASRVPTDYFLLPRTPEGLLAWDWELLGSRLALPMGTCASTPDVVFDTLRRRSDRGGLPFTVRPVMICDAMEPYPCPDLVFLLDAPINVRRARMRERDLRWGTTVAERWQELDATWSSIAPTIRPDRILDGSRPVSELAAIVAAWCERLTSDAQGERRIPVADEMIIPTGTKVVTRDGENLGSVREVQDYYILVDQPDAHGDLEVPSDAVGELERGVLRLTVNRSALSAVDDDESVHREGEGI